MRARHRELSLAVLAALSCLAFTWCAPAWCAGIAGSRLALATVKLPRTDAVAESNSGHFTDAAPPLLAQRVLTREWGESEDSTYVELEIPGYKSEGLAMVLSAVLPGAGQFYVGESSALWFALAEVAAWASRWSFLDQARKFQNQSLQFAGSPYDTNSNWSFARYSDATVDPDTVSLQQLFAGDRDAFYHRIAFDERYKLGWKSDAFVVRDAYQMLEKKYQRHLKRARYATGAVMLTHLVAALDALHAARKNNLPLQRNLRLRLEGSLGVEGEAMTVALERRF
ncbi:MAG: hypothetical protein ABIS67_11760 [Candidatus Eisenbacteria bacterium]